MRLRLEGLRVAGIPRGMMAHSSSQRIQIKREHANTASHIKAVNFVVLFINLNYTYKLK